MRGSNPTSSNLKSISERVQKKQLAQMLRDSYAIDTCEQVQSFVEYQPNILKWLFNELQESLEDENESQRTAIEEFEKRKLDFRYF